MPKMAIGINGGYNESLVDFGSSVRTKRVDGYAVGIQFQLMSRKMLGFETGVFFNQLGWIEVDSTGVSNRGRISTQVIEVPLYSHLALGKGKIRLLLDAGPYFRFIINEEIEGIIQPDTEFENTRPENSASYGLSFRGGLGWRSNRFIIQLRGNYHLGLTNFYDATIATDVSAERSFGGSLSVLIPFGNNYIDE